MCDVCCVMYLGGSFDRDRLGLTLCMCLCMLSRCARHRHRALHGGYICVVVMSICVVWYGPCDGVVDVCGLSIE